MKLRKVLALALVATLSLSMMVGCGSSDSSSSDTSSSDTSSSDTSSSDTSDDTAASYDGVEMTVAWWGNTTRDANTNATLELFEEEHEGLTVDAQANVWDDYWTKIAVSAAGNELPDVLQMDYAYLNQYIESDQLLDLTPYIESGALDLSDVDQGIVDSGTVDGGVYAISLGSNSPALFYNQTLTDSLGIEIPDNMTVEEFKEISAEIYELSGYKTNILAYGSRNVLEYMLRADDIVFLASDNTLGITDSSQLEEFYSMYVEGYEAGWLLDVSVLLETTISTETNALIYGTDPSNMSWCYFANSNEMEAYQAIADVNGEQLAMTSWPSSDSSKSNYYKPAMFFSVAANTDVADLAVELINNYTNSIEYNEILLAERGVPISSVVASAIEDQVSDSVLMAFEYLNTVVAEASSPINPPQGSAYADTVEIMDYVYEQIAYGQIGVDEACDSVYQQFLDLVASYAE